ACLTTSRDKGSLSDLLICLHSVLHLLLPLAGAVAIIQSANYLVRNFHPVLNNFFLFDMRLVQLVVGGIALTAKVVQVASRFYQEMVSTVVEIVISQLMALGPARYPAPYSVQEFGCHIEGSVVSTA